MTTTFIGASSSGLTPTMDIPPTGSAARLPLLKLTTPLALNFRRTRLTYTGVDLLPENWVARS
jgi:hypothetical protein